MVGKRTVGLRYCGGCNPWYDRVAAVERLRARLPKMELCPAAPGQGAVLVVCGCPARCADVSDLDGDLIWLCAPEGLDGIAQKLEREAGL